jgi:hypothetical protein
LENKCGAGRGLIIDVAIDVSSDEENDEENELPRRRQSGL